jgi:predicted DNA-binding transcriptional regulator YafY
MDRVEKSKDRWDKSIINDRDYLHFLNNRVQNSMTLYDRERRVAKIKASPEVAKYFDKGMKKMLPSQEFISKESDGSIIFKLEYTQGIEILPLIQKWMPDLVILEPQELKDEYRNKLKEALKRL